MVLAIVREAAPVATALLIAGAGGSAMTADLGSRKIRDEIAAMEVMAVNPVHRLVTPAAVGRQPPSALFLVSLVSRGRHRRRLLLQRRRPEVTPGRLLPGLHVARAAARPVLVAGQGVGLRVHRRDGRLLQGHLRQGRAEGRGRRREPGRRHHLHPHLLRQLRHDVPLLRAASRRSSDGCRHHASSGPSARGRAAALGDLPRGRRQAARASTPRSCARRLQPAHAPAEVPQRRSSTSSPTSPSAPAR